MLEPGQPDAQKLPPYEMFQTKNGPMLVTERSFKAQDDNVRPGRINVTYYLKGYYLSNAPDGKKPMAAFDDGRDPYLEVHVEQQSLVKMQNPYHEVVLAMQGSVPGAVVDSGEIPLRPVDHGFYYTDYRGMCRW